MKNLLVITLFFSGYSFSLFNTTQMAPFTYFICESDGFNSDDFPIGPSRLLVGEYSMRFNLFPYAVWEKPYKKEEGLKSVYHAEQDVVGKKYKFSFYPINTRLLVKVNDKERKFRCYIR